MRQRNGNDCLQTVLSEGLDICYDLIPRFYENDDTWQVEYNNWLIQYGLFRIIFDLSYSEEIKFPYWSKKPEMIIGILHKESRKHDHAVILIVTEGNVKMKDPKPASGYDLTDLIQVEVIFEGV